MSSHGGVGINNSNVFDRSSQWTFMHRSFDILPTAVRMQNSISIHPRAIVILDNVEYNPTI